MSRGQFLAQLALLQRKAMLLEIACVFCHLKLVKKNHQNSMGLNYFLAFGAGADYAVYSPQCPLEAGTSHCNCSMKTAPSSSSPRPQATTSVAKLLWHLPMHCLTLCPLNPGGHVHFHYFSY